MMTYLSENKNFIPIVLCAGFGTRLRPLTNFIPKVVCPVLDKPISFRNIETFFQAGFEKVHCNVHYLADTVKEELIAAARLHNYDPTRIVFWDEKNILETGGGISQIYNELAKQDKSNLNKDVIAVSGDIIANFPLQDMIKSWENKNNNESALMCTTRALENRKDVTWVSGDNKYVLGFGEKLDSVSEKIPRNFSNHQIIGRDLIPIGKVEAQSSVNLFYKSALKMNKKIIHLEYPEESYWFNIGNSAEYKNCISYFANKEKIKNSSIKIVNYANKIPTSLKSKILNFIEKNKDKKTHVAISEASITISFRENIAVTHQPQLIPLNCLLDEKYEANDFVISI